MDVQKANIMHMPPFMQDGVEMQPLYDFKTQVTTEELASFYRSHLSFHHQKGMNYVAAAGFLLIGLAAGEALLFQGAQGYVFELVSGLGFLAFSFFLSRIMTRSAVRAWKGPDETCYQFYEGGFQAGNARGLDRRSYEWLLEIFLTREAVFLYTEKDRAYILPRKALGDRFEEFVAFLEAKSGKKARVGRRQAA